MALPVVWGTRAIEKRRNRAKGINIAIATGMGLPGRAAPLKSCRPPREADKVAPEIAGFQASLEKKEEKKPGQGGGPAEDHAIESGSELRAAAARCPLGAAGH
jgi:hypothetical protein